MGGSRGNPWEPVGTRGKQWRAPDSPVEIAVLERAAQPVLTRKCLANTAITSTLLVVRARQR